MMILLIICQLVCVTDRWAHMSFVHSILSLKLGVTKWYQSRPSRPRARVGQVCRHGVHCACRPYGVHGMAHVPALDVRSCVLRGNIPGHRLPGCGCVGANEDVGSFEGGVCDIRPVWNLAHSGPYAS